MKISFVLISHNNEDVIENCLNSIKDLAFEILVLDKKSTDKTLILAQKYGAKIIHYAGEEFDKWRDLGIKHSQGDWIFYIDPDERLTLELKNEIKSAVENKNFSAYKMPRRNYWWGRQFKNCGAWPDLVTRLFQKEKLIKWQGIIHESPVFEGQLGELKNPLIHLTHRDFITNLYKGIEWTEMEARLFYQAKHPPVKIKNLLSVFVRKFWQKYIAQKGYKEGIEGFMESVIQSFNRFMVYVHLWQIQQKPNLAQKYKEIDKKISNF